LNHSLLSRGKNPQKINFHPPGLAPFFLSEFRPFFAPQTSLYDLTHTTIKLELVFMTLIILFLILHLHYVPASVFFLGRYIFLRRGTMKKPTVLRGIVKAFTGCFLLLAFYSVQGIWDANAATSSPPKAKSSVKADAAKPAATEAKGAEAKPAPAAEPAGGSLTSPQYVGSQTCITCHQDNGLSLQHSKMGRLMEKRSGVAFDKACENCHGPGSLHVEGADDKNSANFKTIKFPPKLAAPEANAICLSCHEAKSHFHWQGSPHDLKNITCVSCHSIHQDLKKPNAHLLKTAKTMDTCFTCHMEKKAQISRNGHMPLNEDAMTCTSCHDMHGTSGDKNLVADSVRETCFKCHADKRGPFLFEHPPAQESCLNCHNPHGSNNNHMLVERAPFLCLRCHTPHAGYGANDVLQQGSRMMHEGCLNCHSNMHGSNHPSGPKFQR
jgi:DmsE family decaheme c-type cytochrome